jgi:hypothetical protein
MRRVGFIAMLAALAVWLAPAPWCGFCAAAEHGHATHCCAPAQIALPAACCAHGVVSALPPARSADAMTQAGAVEVQLQMRAAVSASDRQPVSVLHARLSRRSKPPAVLRT